MDYKETIWVTGCKGFLGREIVKRLKATYDCTVVGTDKELMVTAFDVKYGKPHPEPYLMALKKGDLKADEAVVIENAPLGVEAGHKAGIFTIAVNTGPLDGQVLLDAGADLLFPSMQALCDSWDTILL